MADFAQVIAAVAAGAVLTVATMLVLKLHKVECRTERERRINDATDAVVAGVETFRQQAQAAPASDDDGASRAPDDVVEIRSKAHLRMLAGRDAGAPPGSPVGCERKQQDRTTRRRRARESRP